MTDYHYIAEMAYDKNRLAGTRTWLELTHDERDTMARFVRSAEDILNTPSDTWCPDCDDYRYDMERMEDEMFDLEERIKELEDEVRSLRDKK